MKRLSRCLAWGLGVWVSSACGVGPGEEAAAPIASQEQGLSQATVRIKAINDGWVTDDASNTTEGTYNVGKI